LIERHEREMTGIIPQGRSLFNSASIRKASEREGVGELCATGSFWCAGVGPATG
jgi:hypothetical protein